MKRYSRKRLQRKGMTAVELLFIFAAFVLATFAIFNIGQHIIQIYFHDGNQFTSSPLI